MSKKGEHALYSKEELDYNRSIGLDMTDEENENFYRPSQGKTYHWTNEEFESWLSTKDWPEQTKDHHRCKFEGVITFDNGVFRYE